MSRNKTAEAGVGLVQEYFNLREYDVRWVSYEEDREFQYHFGDAVVKKGGEVKNVEVKTEAANKYGNFFIETWSNKQTGRKGWLYNLDKCDLLYYVFLKEQAIYVIDFPELRKFDLTGYQEKEQWKTVQANDTWGCPVPIKTLVEAGIASLRRMSRVREKYGNK